MNPQDKIITASTGAFRIYSSGPNGADDNGFVDDIVVTVLANEITGVLGNGMLAQLSLCN